MNASELIEILKQCPPETQVKALSDESGEWYDLEYYTDEDKDNPGCLLVW